MLKNRKKIKRLSQKQESKSARVLGTITTPSSGNKWYAKGDSQSKDLHVENKCTFKKSYSVKLEDLQKLERQAGVKIPVLEIQFKPGDETFIVLKREDFVGMREESETEPWRNNSSIEKKGTQEKRDQTAL